MLMGQMVRMAFLTLGNQPPSTRSTWADPPFQSARTRGFPEVDVQCYLGKYQVSQSELIIPYPQVLGPLPQVDVIQPWAA